MLGPHFKPVVWTADSTTGGDLVRVSPPGMNGGDHPDYSPDGQWITLRTENGVPGLAKLLMAHTDGTGLRILLDGSNRQRFFSSGFSPDGTGFTLGIAPGVGADGNADVFVGQFDKPHARDEPDGRHEHRHLGELAALGDGAAPSLGGRGSGRAPSARASLTPSAEGSAGLGRGLSAVAQARHLLGDPRSGFDLLHHEVGGVRLDDAFDVGEDVVIGGGDDEASRVAAHALVLGE